MAPKKNKSKFEGETTANLSTGWHKSKMSESLVRELENMGLLQSQGVIQWRAGEGEDYPMEGTLEAVMFHDFVERGLALPLSEFFYKLLQFWGICNTWFTKGHKPSNHICARIKSHVYTIE